MKDLPLSDDDLLKDLASYHPKFIHTADTSGIDKQLGKNAPVFP
jgi:hypothetical protein